MAKNILLSEGLTSIINTETGEANRAKAAQVAASINRSQRYSTCSVNNLAEWADAPLFRYASQAKIHQDFVKEFYSFKTIKYAIASGDDPPSYDACEQQFDALSGQVKDQLSISTAQLHAIILYFTWAFIVPFYINKRATGGHKTIHWTPIRDPGIKAQRLAMFDLVKTIKAAEYILRAPPGMSLLEFYEFGTDTDDEGIRYLLDRQFAKQGEKAAEGQTASTSSSGIASHFVHSMWTSSVLLGRQPHPVSVISSLRTSEFHLLTKGHGCPEDLLSGRKIVPPLSYASLVSDDDFVSSKEYAFLCDFTREPFYVDIGIADVYDVYRATRLASKASTDEDIHDVARQIFNATSDNGRANYANAISLVFPALRSTHDRLKPDANDILAIQSYLPGANVTAIAASGSVLAYTVNKFLGYFEDEISNQKRQIRANITESRALDRGGIKSRVEKGNLPAEVEGPLESMVRALRQQVWLKLWETVVAPWLLANQFPQTAQGWLGVELDQSAALVSFASSVGFTKADYIRLQATMLVELAMFRQQVYRDCLVQEFSLQRRDGMSYYHLDLSRSFKTASSSNQDSLPHLTTWDLSSYESCLVHGLVLLRPILTVGAGKTTNHFFINKTGQCIGQRDIKDIFQFLGREWMAIPELSSHNLRSAYISKFINSGLINTDNELQLLSAAVQVSRRTMVESYAACTFENPVRQIARRIRNAGLDDLDDDKDMDEVEEPAASRPYGVALSKVRESYKPLAALAVEAHGGSTKEAFASLVRSRAANNLGTHEKWFQHNVTWFSDTDANNFDRWYWGKNKSKRARTA